jgi:hypothetical protein
MAFRRMPTHRFHRAGCRAILDAGRRLCFGSKELRSSWTVRQPFALLGGIGVLWLRGMNLNPSVSVGFIVLFWGRVRVVVIAAVLAGPGGLIWQAKDSNNDYIFRANANEDNVVPYRQ